MEAFAGPSWAYDQRLDHDGSHDPSGMPNWIQSGQPFDPRSYFGTNVAGLQAPAYDVGAFHSLGDATSVASQDPQRRGSELPITSNHFSIGHATPMFDHHEQSIHTVPMQYDQQAAQALASISNGSVSATAPMFEPYHHLNSHELDTYIAHCNSYCTYNDIPKHPPDPQSPTLLCDDGCSRNICDTEDCGFNIQCQLDLNGGPCSAAFQDQCAFDEHVAIVHGLHVGGSHAGEAACELDPNGQCQLPICCPGEICSGTPNSCAQVLSATTGSPSLIEVSPNSSPVDVTVSSSTSRSEHLSPLNSGEGIWTMIQAPGIPQGQYSPIPAFNGMSVGMARTESSGSANSAASSQASAGATPQCLWADPPVVNPCSLTFSDTQTLHEHVLAAHVGYPAPAGENGAKPGHRRRASRECQWSGCARAAEGRPFDQAQHLRDHLASHTRYRPVHCTEAGCEQSFKDQKELKQHESKHTGNRPFQCPKCPKAYAHQPSLKTHMREHTGERPFLCPDCGHRDKDKANFKRHMQKHAEPQFICEACRRKFTKKGNQKRHYATCKALAKGRWIVN